MRFIQNTNNNNNNIIAKVLIMAWASFITNKKKKIELRVKKK